MSELRRKALTSGKTTSRKAASRATSAASSRAGSTANSAATSRGTSRGTSHAGSDDELSDSEEHMSPPPAAPSISLASLSIGNTQLNEVIDVLLEPKALSSGKREQQLTLLANILAACYTPETVSPHLNALQTLLIRLLRTSTTPGTQAPAARALGLIYLTCPESTDRGGAQKALRGTITDTAEDCTEAKAAAIRALAVMQVFTQDEDDIIELMQFFFEIVESDGYSAQAQDDAVVVSAALEAWGFLATFLDDAQDATEEAMDALLEQLESSELSVQVAAGETIALLFEKAWTPAEEDELTDKHLAGTQYIQRYNPCPRMDLLKPLLTDLSSGSKKHMKKEDRKVQRGTFVDIAHTVENPRDGPRFRESLTTKTGSGRRNKSWIRSGDGGMLRIDRWWKLLRVQFLKNLLGPGFAVHWTENEQLGEATELVAEWDDE